MKIQRFEAKQAHPFPKSIMNPQGPFPRELFNEKPVVDDYEPELAEDGANHPLGATAQNGFKQPRTMICSECHSRVLENKTGDHECRD
jgi:hypothetical protein